MPTVIVKDARDATKGREISVPQHQQHIQVSGKTYHHVSEDSKGRWVYIPLR